MKDQEKQGLKKSRGYIFSVDFNLIISQLIQKQGWTFQDATTASNMYRNYLYLIRKYGNSKKLPPSVDIDEVWHNHILDTKKYREDCEVIFGSFKDHYPYFGIDENSNKNDLIAAFEETRRLYEIEFGEPLYQLRGILKKTASFFRINATTRKRFKFPTIGVGNDQMTDQKKQMDINTDNTERQLL